MEAEAAPNAQTAGAQSSGAAAQPALALNAAATAEADGAARRAAKSAGAVAEMAPESPAEPGEAAERATDAAPVATDEASLRLRRRLGKPPAGQAWARSASVPKSSADLPDAETEEVASVGRAGAEDQGSLRPMPRRRTLARSGADEGPSESRRSAEGMRSRRLMTTGVVDRLPRPRTTEDAPEERRTGAVRRLSRFGAAIDRQASFKPPERTDASGLREAGVEVHVGGAAAGNTTGTTAPGTGDDEIVTIQRPASELAKPAEASDIDDTAELNLADLTPQIMDEDEPTSERKLPRRGE